MQKSNIPVMYGIIIGLALVAHYAMIAGLGAFGQTGLNFIAWAILLTGIFWGVFQYKRTQGGYLPFNAGFKIGMFITLIAGLTEAVGKFIYGTFINPGVKDQLIEAALIALEQLPGLTEELLDQSIERTEMMAAPHMVSLSGLIGTLVLGLIGALIAAAIFKQDTPPLRTDEIGM